MAIETHEDLDTVIGEVIEVVVKNTSERAKKLLQEYINMDTYGIGKTNMGKPKINKSYLDGTGTPSYEFRDKAWDIKLEKYLFSLFYDGDLMSAPSSSSPYLHGNANDGIDRRNELADILNVSGVASDGDMYTTKSREPFWDDFIQDLNQQIGRWLYTEFNNKGISIPALKLYKGQFIG